MAMPVYQIGSNGDEVARIQEALQSKGFYRGPVDGRFGGGTSAAVREFQRANGLTADGRADSATWSALFGQQTAMPQPALLHQDLARRCLALTGAFETGRGVPDCFCGLGGDFDGQGISFGVLQWNFGQGSLQPLLREMSERHPTVTQAIFGNHLATLAEALSAGQDELMAFVRSVQHPVKHTVFEPWHGYAMALGRTTEFQDIQVKHAKGNFDKAVGMCRDYGVWSERAVALMFDIVTQNGSIRKITQTQILADFGALPGGLSREETEQRKLEIVANRRAEAANPRWIDDVRRRKLCIARGTGSVHGIDYDLEQQFGIGLREFAG
jgi:hypothetical protein